MKRASAEDAYDARVQAKELIENFQAGILTTRQSVAAHARREIDMRQVAYMLRMAMCWTVISLSKLNEFWSRYGALAEGVLAEDMRQILRSIRDRDVDDFRNTIAAHMVDRGTKNPVPQNEVEQRLMKVWGGHDVGAFLHWLDHSVCATLRRFRKHVAENYEIIEPEFVRNAQRLHLPPHEDD